MAFHSARRKTTNKRNWKERRKKMFNEISGRRLFPKQPVEKYALTYVI